MLRRSFLSRIDVSDQLLNIFGDEIDELAHSPHRHILISTEVVLVL